MYDIVTGEMLARATGHGEAINGIIFLPDCKHLVSVSKYMIQKNEKLNNL